LRKGKGAKKGISLGKIEGRKPGVSKAKKESFFFDGRMVGNHKKGGENLDNLKISRQKFAIWGGNPHY